MAWSHRIGCGAGHAYQRNAAGHWRRWDPTAINQNIAAQRLSLYWRCPRGQSGNECPVTITLGKLSLAVVPPAPYDRDEKLTDISKGIADDLTIALARSKTFHVIAHNRICSDGDDPRLIARELGARYLIVYLDWNCPSAFSRITKPSY